MAQVLGILSMVWKGQRYELDKGSSFIPGGLINNAMVIGTQTHRSQEGKSSELDASIPFPRGATVNGLLGNMTEGELQVHADTGQVWVVTDAFRAGGETVSTDGKLKFRLIGGPAAEVS